MKQSNRLYQSNILIKTFLYLGSYATFLVLTILGGVFYITGSLEKINQSTIEFDDLSHEVEVLSYYLGQQTEERKNLLLRGNYLRNFQRYSLRVDQMSEKIYAKIDEIEHNPLSAPYQSDLNFFKIRYNHLMRMYYYSHSIFHKTQDYQKSDRFIRGYGGKAGRKMYDIVRQIRQDRQELLAKNQKDIKKFLIISTSSLVLIILAYSAVLIAVVTDPIRRIVRFTNFLETQNGHNFSQIETTKQENYSLADLKQTSIYAQVHKSDEIGYMVDTYSKLTNSIIEYSNTLEQEVQKRTRELRTAKEAAEIANKTKSNFLANMSHELRTPLNAILGFTQLLQLNSSLERSQKEKLAIISRSGEHLLSLINDILDLSKIEAGKIELNGNDFDLLLLLKSIEEMLRLKANVKGIDFIFEWDSNTPQYVYGDERKLRQILINLLGNALKFTNKGNITIKVKPDSQNIYRLIFTVEDTGIGIAEHELDVLFKAFSQTDSGKKSGKGTGLGLSISRKFIQLMQGDIKVRSKLGLGTVFTFDIVTQPVQEKKLLEPQINKKVVGLAPNQPQYRILVADDNQENRQIVLQLLESIGFEVREATNGKEAIAIWQSWQPQLICMDIQMPVLDGYQASRRIKLEDKEKNTIILALTASVLEEERFKVLSSGCDDFLRKPFRISELLARLEKHLQVEYIYQESEPFNPIISPLSVNSKKVTLTPADLEMMPREWLERINQAALIADYGLIQELIAEIQEDYNLIAQELDNWLQEFRMDKISELTGEACLQKT